MTERISQCICDLLFLINISQSTCIQHLIDAHLVRIYNTGTSIE